MPPTYVTADAGGHISGTLLGLNSTSPAGVRVDSFPLSIGSTFPAKPAAHYSPDMSYIAIVNNAGGGDPVVFGSFDTIQITPGTDYVFFSFIIYSPVDGVTDQDVLFCACGPSEIRDLECFELYVNYKTGDLKVFDAAAVLKHTETGAFAAGKWYQIEGKFERKATNGEFILRMGEYKGTQNEILNTTMDLLGDATFGLKLFCGYTPQSTDADHYFGQYMIRTDPEATIDHADGSPWHANGANVLGPYQSALRGVVPTVSGGDDLTSGSFGNAQEDPASDSLTATYSVGGGAASKKGIMTTNHGSIGGPDGDSRVTGNFTAGMWVFRGKALSGFGKTRIRFHYGKIATGTPASDGTKASARYNGTGAFVDYKFVEDVGGGFVPSESGDYMQFGFEGVSGFDGGDVVLAEMVASVWHVLPAPSFVPYPRPRGARGGMQSLTGGMH